MGLAAFVTLGVLALPSPTGALGEPASLSPGSVRRRTPPEDAWSLHDFDERTFFDARERRGVTERAAARRLLAGVVVAVDVIWFAFFLFTSLSVRLRDACGRLGARLARLWPFSTRPALFMAGLPRRLLGPDWASVWLFAWVYFGLGALTTLPLALWGEALEQAAGLSAYAPPAWIWDTTKQLAIQLLLFSCLVTGLYGLSRRLPRAWWLVLGLPAGLALVAYGVVEPRLARIHDDVTPLSSSPNPGHRALGPRLEALGRAEGLRLEHIHVMRASRTTRTLDARLVGLGRSRELVVWDTLLEDASPREVEVAVAHELGHEHVRQDVVTYVGGALALVGLLGLISVVLGRGGRRRGMRGPGDVATWPLVGFTLWLALHAIHPALAWRQRAHERAADRRALVLTGDPEAFVRLQTRLAVRNQQELRPPHWISRLWMSHPSPSERIAMARWYASWLRGRGIPVPPPLP